VAARTATRGLSTAELEHIRDALAGGRKPKVMFTPSAGQIAGQLGQVVRLTDPGLSDEWVVVRFGRDELPFSPTDLVVAPKGAAPLRRPATRGGDPEPAVTGPPLLPDDPVDEPRVPAPREETTVSATAVRTADSTSAAPGDAGPAAPTPDTTADPAGNGKATDAKPSSKTARKAARPKPAPSLTVTLSYADGEWMVAAQQGSRTLARPYVVRAAEALRMVGMLDVPGVHEAVEEIVSAARAEAEAAADKLRAELAEVEARLAELREAG